MGHISEINRSEGSSCAALEQHFAAFVAQPEFPCLGAKSAFNSGSYKVRVYQELAHPFWSKRLARDLEAFQNSETRRVNEYATFVAIFREPRNVSEEQFERLLWSQLQQLHTIDARRYPWDSSVSSDLDDPHFSFSFAGTALYTIGMHANSCRLARRFAWPTLIFNPHEQFERLRRDGRWRRMQESIRHRDVALQGSINPMLSDFGETSEARQYAGRAVEKDWHPAFHPEHRSAKVSRCPFAH
jgi:FPC/CPF motif-containing protein YcgG